MIRDNNVMPRLVWFRTKVCIKTLRNYHGQKYILTERFDVKLIALYGTITQSS